MPTYKRVSGVEVTLPDEFAPPPETPATCPYRESHLLQDAPRARRQQARFGLSVSPRASKDPGPDWRWRVRWLGCGEELAQLFRGRNVGEDCFGPV